MAKVFAGAWSTLAIDADGTVWAWGLNNYSQASAAGVHELIGVMYFSWAFRTQATLCSHPSTLTSGTAWFVAPACVPTQSNQSQNISSFAIGQHHVIALARDGKVYSIGRGDYGRLGHGDQQELAECGAACNAGS